MFVSVEKFNLAYHNIKVSALTGDSTVLICVSPDVDALCACSMLKHVLQCDFISYKIVPIANYDDVEAVKKECTENPGKFKWLIFLNAGATVDLVSLFECAAGQANNGLSFLVVDSHRPIDLNNVYDTEYVYILDDGSTQERVPSEEDMFGIPSDSESEDEAPNKRHRDTGEELSRDERRAMRMAQEEREYNYYAATYHGPSSALLLWQLVQDLGRGTNSLLWLAIVGLTDQLVHDRIDSAVYHTMAAELNNDVTRLNGVDALQDSSSSSSSSSSSGEAGGLQLATKQEYKFLLLRHCSVYEAMVHSRYVGTRLCVWRNKGIVTLRNLLAKMGMSVKQAQQRFLSMDADSRQQFETQLPVFAPDYGLDNLTFLSFVAQEEFRTQLSAPDVVYATAALLESNSSGTSAGEWKLKFFKAIDALQPDKFADSERKMLSLREGLSLAIVQEKGLWRHLENIIEGKHNVQRSKNFRHVIIKDDAHQEMLTHAPLLCKLGTYLVDVYRFSEARKKALPLLLAAFNPVSETYLVVGLWAESRRVEGSVVPNEFGMLFRNSCEKIQARYRLNSFDSAVLEIQSDDLSRFFMALAAEFKAIRS